MRVFVTPHALQRIEERGGDVEIIAAAARRAARRFPLPPRSRAALDIPYEDEGVKTGLLWYDDAPGRDLEQKVQRAAAHYKHKYGLAPNLCLVHPTALDGNGKRANKKVNGRDQAGPLGAATPFLDRCGRPAGPGR